ncbi:hypothetical protein GCM10011509_05720 [Ornithinimicrobium pekingense]|uniref:DinB-like domain-containing protein n=2 Tax=Ornithinimicrobium pekingense TaxID=384677 RepID=A0ABQ2F4N9_9MICO|nr:hypothetical protein GCM10011509_05720 [Ornithinimicrobium pekingense]
MSLTCEDRVMTSPMSHVRSVLLDGFQRVEDGVASVLEDLDADDLCWRPDPGANPVGWLLWHLSRQQDAQLAALAEVEQVWAADGWHDRLGLPYGPRASGFGQSAEEVGRFRVEDPTLLGGYAAAVHGLTRRLLDSLEVEDLDRVVDTRWDPPVTVGVRVYSVLEDATKHLGQAEYVKGMLGRR